MPNIKIGEYDIKEYQQINILFGKNGSGKSSAFKDMTEKLLIKNAGLVKYITPERGGILTYQANIEQNMQNPSWSNQVRQRNQFAQFKEQSVVLFKDLKSMIDNQLTAHIATSEQKTFAQGELLDLSFEPYIKKINSLLDNIEIRQDKSSFSIYFKNKTEQISSEKISSGESELITLAIECLAYSVESKEGEENFLFLDEPDVHIHPDLQVRFMHFLRDLVAAGKFIVFIATHSTAIIGALEDYEDIGFNFFVRDQKSLCFKKASEEYKSILPIFGAHPLSNIYCQTPIFLVEGDDDMWIWQQAIKSSAKLKIYPCSVSGEGNMLNYENKVNELILSVYDSPEAKGYSLRDKDDRPTPYIDTPPSLSKVERFVLSCRCSENLLLSDDVLANAEFTWEKLKEELNSWITHNSSHKNFNLMNSFKNEGFNRKEHPAKEIINIITGIISNKPWQVLVGQTIGLKIKEGNLGKNYDTESSLDSYLGEVFTNFHIKPSWLSKSAALEDENQLI